MNIFPIEYYRLSNGLRVVYRRCDSRVDYCGVTVNVGSRDEIASQYGLAHFVEHTIFKGTERRKAWHIINRMEAVGGELNAFTTKEETTIYTVAPEGNVERSLELLGDLISGSRFPKSELDKERDVVMDEINSYLDTPSEAVFDDFDDLLFADSELGHNILGSEEVLSNLDSDDCRGWLHKYYVPENMVLFYAGNCDMKRVIRIAERHMGGLHHQMPTQSRRVPMVAERFDEYRSIDSHQAHTVIGCRIPGMYDENRWGVALLTNILGGPGMNSLLNVALRERRGLVYTVDASTAMYTDSGAFTIYFGCDGEDSKRCRRLALEQIERLASERMSDRALEQAKRQYVGQLTVAGENREQMALSMGRAMLYHDRVMMPQEGIERIMAVDSEALRRVAEMVAPEHCSVLTLGR